MAGNTSGLVSAAKPQKGGAIFTAPAGTAIPTDATTALDPAFVKLGYASNEGLSNTIERDSEDVQDWGGETVLTLNTSRKETFGFTLIQSLDIDVLKEVYGQMNVTQAGGTSKPIVVDHNAKDMPHRVFVFEMLMNGGHVKRIVVPDGQITELGDVAYKANEAVGYEVTATAYPAAALDGGTAREFIAKIG